MLDLGPNDIHVWLAFIDAVPPDLHSAYAPLLEPSERAQMARFHFEKDRRRYLVTRALVRTVLSEYHDVPPSEWRFVANAHGRPEITTEIAKQAGLSFNLSHTRSLVALATARHREIGVDVEDLDRQNALLDIADRFFAPDEVRELMRLPAAEQRLRFFELWTLKESYIKARGLGLAIPLDKFSFDLRTKASVRLQVDRVLGDRADRWRFWQFQPSDAHMFALCAQSAPNEEVRITLRHAVPLNGGRELACAFARRSA